MAITANFGFNDTTNSSAAQPALNPTVLNYGSDYRVISDDDSSCLITNIKTPVDQPDTIRVATQDVANIYSNTSLKANQISAARQGVSVVLQENSVYKVIDTDLPLAATYLPVSMHLVLKVPTGYSIPEADLISQIKRLLGALYEEDGTFRIQTLVKGAVKPKNL